MNRKFISKLREKSIEAVVLKGSLYAKNLKFRDTGINSKTFHYWKMNGLLSTIDSGAWAEISFIEYLWLRVLENMRGFGCSLKLTQKIHYDLFVKAYEENLAERTLYDKIAYYRNKEKLGMITDFESQELAACESNAKDPLIGIALRTEITYFSQRVVGCFENGEDLNLIIYPDETYEFKYENKKTGKPDRPHIFISLTYFITQLLEDEDKDEFVSNAGIFSEDEMRVIRELRNKNVDSIIISFHENGAVKNIDYDKKGLIQGDKVKDVMRILGLKNFDSITMNIRNGTTLSFTKTGKNKIQ